MMIGPDAYYEVNLKGRDKDYILSAIREMQDKIARLKELMENPENKHKDIVHPSEDVQIKCTRDYIARAIQAYEELCGTYHPSELEKADLEFQKNIGNISKIAFEIGGFFKGRTEYVVEFAGEEALLTKSGMFSYEQNQSVLDREEVMDALEELHIGEWEKFYDPMRFGYCVMDGTQWSITFEYEVMKARTSSVSIDASCSGVLRSQGTFSPSQYFLTVLREIPIDLAMLRWLSPFR